MVTTGNTQLNLSELFPSLITVMIVVMMMKMMSGVIAPPLQLQAKKVELEESWWSKYQYKDTPAAIKNPHFESVYQQTSPDKQAITQMAIGLFREQNPKKKAAKYEYLKGQLEGYGVYLDLTPKQILTGRWEYVLIIASAAMEVIAPTGLYAKK